MSPEVLDMHLRELGVRVGLAPGSRSLKLDAPAGVLSPELLELVRECRDELVELVYLREEAEAIAAEGSENEPPAVDGFLGQVEHIERALKLPEVRWFARYVARLGAHVVEVKAA